MNTVAPQRNASNYCTVAELVARERAAYTPYRRPRRQPRERQLQPVTELLRREGIEFDGEDTPTIEMPTTRIHVSQLTRRATEPAQDFAQPEQPEQPGGAKARRQTGAKNDKHRGGKFGAISSAAVLCGLTVAGLVALKPTIASGPADTLADAAGTPGDRTTSEARFGGIQPTSTVLNASSTAETSQQTAGGAAAQQSSGIGGGVRATQQSSEPRTAAPGPSRTVAPVPAEETQRQSEPSKENEDDGVVDNTADTVDDTLGPVTDPVEDTVDPVTGTISGTLAGVLG